MARPGQHGDGRRNGRATEVLVVVSSLLLLLACTGEVEDPAASSSGTTTTTRPDSSDSLLLTVPRAAHKATALTDGRVLMTGGCSLPGCEGFDRAQPAELFDPIGGTFTRVGRMRSPRAGHSATLLRDGRVLVVGGYPGEGRDALYSAEVFDPRTEQFRMTGEMAVGRADHTATLLADGRVLIAGGTRGDGRALDTTVLFDPRSDRFAPGPRLTTGRSGHAAVLAAGRLMLLGGTADLSSGLSTTEVLQENGWAAGPELTEPRTKHAAVALTDGSVLVVGGSGDVEGRTLLSSTEVVSVTDGRSTPGPDLAEGQYKLDGAVMALSDGRVVIGGGRSVEVFDPARDTLDVLDGPTVPRRSFVSVSPVARSEVLIAGGYDGSIRPTAHARVIRIP